MASRDDLRRRCPDFRYESDEDVDGALADAALELDPLAFGAQYEKAACYLAAHMLAFAKRGVEGGAGAGPVTSQGVGTAGFASSPMDDLESTPWGRQFKRLRRRTQLGIMTT